MSLNTTTLFTRLGGLIYTATTSVAGFRGTTLPARAAAIESLYASPDLNLIDGLYSSLATAQAGAASFARTAQSIARATVIQMVNSAAPQPNSSLATALTYLASYMAANGQTVQRNTVSASVAAGGSNTGDGVVRAGVTSNLGVPLEYAFAEAIAAAVTRDSQTGGATSGQESLGVSGQLAVTDALSWLYPAGSGASASLRAIDASSADGSTTRNQLANGNFETWTVANIPDGWHIRTGTAGTTVLHSTSEHYAGSSSLEIAGNGSEHTAIYTQFGVDFTAAAVALDQLAVNFWAKVSGVPAGGVLTVELVDGSGSAINDAAGNAAAFTVSLPGLTTSWAAFGGFLRLPRVLPAAVSLQFRLSAALDNAVNLFIDRAALARPVSLYPGGPLLAAFSGATPWIAGDSFTVTVTNDHAGLLQSGCDRLLSLRSSGLILPSAASSPTISDSLVA